MTILWIIAIVLAFLGGIGFAVYLLNAAVAEVLIRALWR